MTEKPKILKTDDIRKIVFEARNKLMGVESVNNRLNKKYLAKVRYMLFWLSLIPVRKEVMDNWEMPDYNTIMKMKKGKKYGY